MPAYLRGIPPPHNQDCIPNHLACADLPHLPPSLPQVLPELQSPRINDVPILKADAIKFVTTFR
jgi:hypothetical protein